MRALRQTSSNGPRDLRLITDAPVPAPGPGQILIRVGAAGVNFADVMQTCGTYGGGPQAPYALMAELAELRTAGVHTPGRPTVFDLADGPEALAALAAGSTVGKLALRP